MNCVCCDVFFVPTLERIEEFPESLQPPTCEQCFKEIYEGRMKKMYERIEALKKDNEELRRKLEDPFKKFEQ